jgi:hypothetical protein
MLLSGRFFDYLLSANRPRLDGFRHWIFHPGMLFQARQQWWGLEQSRPTPHEGLDLCRFEDIAGNPSSLDDSTVIPAPFAGTVVNISGDFLGRSIFLAHDLEPMAGRRLYTAVGHTTPRKSLVAGQLIAEAEIIASVSTPVNPKTTVPPHLHLTLAIVPDTVAPEQLTWKYLSTGTEIRLLNPLEVFPTNFIII